jgi:hypothetical protein
VGWLSILSARSTLMHGLCQAAFENKKSRQKLVR